MVDWQPDQGLGGFTDGGGNWAVPVPLSPGQDAGTPVVNDTLGGGLPGIDGLPQATAPFSGAPGSTTPGAPGTEGGAAGGTPGTPPRRIAAEVLAHVPLPDIRVAINPGIGLVNMAGWFWIEGYEGQPLRREEVVEIPPEVSPGELVGQVPADDPRRQPGELRVEVRVWPTGYRWDFGDGASLVSRSRGQRFPQQSDVQHTYEFSSLRHPQGFPVRVTVEFAAEYRIDGGPPEALPPVARTYGGRYRVQEVQAVLVGR